MRWWLIHVWNPAWGARVWVQAHTLKEARVAAFTAPLCDIEAVRVGEPPKQFWW